jgi:hypothetical protein
MTKYRLREEEDYVPGLREDKGIMLVAGEGVDINEIDAALKDLKNYGKYIDNISSPDIEREMEIRFGPSLFRSREALENNFAKLSKDEWMDLFKSKKIKDLEEKYTTLEDNDGKFPKSVKGDREKIILSLRRTPNMLSYEIKGNTLVFPGTNDLVRVKNTTIEALKNAGFIEKKDYKFISTINGEPIKAVKPIKEEQIRRLRKFIKEEVKSILGK